MEHSHINKDSRLSKELNGDIWGCKIVIDNSYFHMLLIAQLADRTNFISQILTKSRHSRLVHLRFPKNTYIPLIIDSCQVVHGFNAGE